GTAAARHTPTGTENSHDRDRCPPEGRSRLTVDDETHRSLVDVVTNREHPEQEHEIEVLVFDLRLVAERSRRVEAGPGRDVDDLVRNGRTDRLRGLAVEEIGNSGQPFARYAARTQGSVVRRTRAESESRPIRAESNFKRAH